MAGLEDLMQEAIEKTAKRLLIKAIVVGKATDVTDTKCNVVSDGDPDIIDVRLNAIDDDMQTYFTVVPAEGSYVLAGIIENETTEAVVLRCSEVQKVICKIGDLTFVFDKDTIKYNDGNNDGLVNIKPLVNKLNAIENIINNLLNLVTAAAMAGTLSDAATLKAAIIAGLGQGIQPITMQSDLEDKKVLH